MGLLWFNRKIGLYPENEEMDLGALVATGIRNRELQWLSRQPIFIAVNIWRKATFSLKARLARGAAARTVAYWLACKGIRR